MKRTNKDLDQARQVARDKYAWPGGYPLYLVMADGEVLCPDCAKSNWRAIVENTLMPVREYPELQWRALGADINYEDSNLHCSHCYARIESAYCEEE
jgi:hypothetical protein